VVNVAQLDHIVFTIVSYVLSFSCLYVPLLPQWRNKL